VPPQQKSVPDLNNLVSLFYESPDALGQFEPITADDMPAPDRRLLAHNEHMTVTVEEYHRSPVDVQVLSAERSETDYARKILLRRQSDRQVVQFGIVRFQNSYLAPQVRDEIEQEQIPLGRVLIEHNVLRQVQLASLWQIAAGDELREHFSLRDNRPVFGRTALIYCDGEPAVELLEIVTPSE